MEKSKRFKICDHIAEVYMDTSPSGKILYKMRCHPALGWCMDIRISKEMYFQILSNKGRILPNF